ncbi:hypothetical protein JCM10296v2_007468 [Rhodotorula toruloides]
MSTPSNSRLHRRTSSAALHTSYTPLVGGPGDIASSLDPAPAFSSATAPHSRSVSLGYAEVDAEDVDDKKDDEGEEKDGLIPRYNNPSRLGSGAGVWRSVPSRKSRGGKGGWWKCKVFLVLLIATAVGGLVWYSFFAPPATRETMEEVKGWWSAFRSGTASAAAAEGTGVGWSGLKLDEINWTTTTTPPATSHSLAHTTAAASTKSHHVPAAVPTSFATGSRFAHVEQVIRNGSLGAYNWHAVLPRIEEENGRVIVVGDIHGTHRSLLSLLSHLHFRPSSSDVLIHTGDLPHKSSLASSLHTISLLRRLEARGVKGNTDQRVVEWRVWMESVGPLDLSQEEEEEGKKAGAYRVPEGLKSGQKPSFGRLRRPSRPSPADEEKEQERRVPQPREREKRAGGSSWFGWLTGDEEEEFESAEADAEVVQELSSAARVDEGQTSAVKEATGRRRPFGRPTRTGASSVSTLTPTRSSAASRPSATSSSSDGSLLGPLYSHLSPSFPSSRLHALKLPLPSPSSGLTWGSPEFELARHLPAADFAYLKTLPLTLWVEELGSWVVHAGMVAPNSSALEHAAGGKGWSAHDFPPNAMLDSSNPRAFAPSSSRISRLLRSSSKWSILLEEPNTDPWTLMNLRTLEPTKDEGAWKVSAKGGRKASRGSRPWWKVWEEEMSACARHGRDVEDEDEGWCEEAGIVYGHWAGQGLQVHEHSIGLDTGCVYGRRLSALVVPLSNSSRSPTFASSSSNASKSSLSASASTTATTRGSNPKAKGKANWHGGMQKVTVSAPASSAASTSSAASRSSASHTTSTDGGKETALAYDGYEEDELDYPDSSTFTSSASSDANSATDSKKPWWKPWKRAPPQGRPGVAPWEGMEELQVDFDANEADEEEKMGGMTEVWTGGKKARPTASRTTSSSVVATPTPSAPSLEILRAEAADELEASAFHERRVTLYNGRTGQIVSVDCAGEVEVD